MIRTTVPVGRVVGSSVVVPRSVVVPGSDYNTIVAWTPQPTVTLYACHPPHSKKYRYVVHLALVQ